MTNEGPFLGPGQYRNAVASGWWMFMALKVRMRTVEQALPRYGTDPVQQRDTEDTEVAQRRNNREPQF
jgi:hypothetical protein